MKSVFLIYTTDAHHSYASYSLSGVFHTKEGAIDALHPQLRKSAFAEYKGQGYETAMQMLEDEMNMLRSKDQTQGFSTNYVIEEKELNKSDF